MIITSNLYSEKKTITSWNNTYRRSATIIYPSNINELKNLLKKFKISKISYLIRTGSCAYDSKSINPNNETYIVSLKKLNKIIKIDKVTKCFTVEAGAKISEILNNLKEKNFTLFSVPGGSEVSIGGAISANVIGKDSSKLFPAFADTIEYLEILSENGTIKRLKKKDKKMRKLVGAFGMNGLIIKACLKIKKIKSKNLKVSTQILKDPNEVKKELDTKYDYNYVQIDPFFRKTHFAVSFRANYIRDDRNYYKKINLKSNIIEKSIFIFSSFFINFLSWKIFYKFFFILNKNKKYLTDIHNFHYNSKYKHMVPLICRGGLLDYEVLIKSNFNKNLSNIIKLLQKNKLFPIYVIAKKLYKSKKKIFLSI